jgi:pimeloyl-ACP methyl ester carboxylesterase
MYINHKKILLSLILFLLLNLFSCDSNTSGPVAQQEYDRGEVISSDVTSRYSVPVLKNLLALSGLDEADIPGTLTYSTKIYKIIYQSVDANGNKIELSGALIIPDTALSFPFLTICHGTETKRTAVASILPINSGEGFLALVTGSLGFVTAVPDYPGLGVSTTIHPYVHAKSLALSIIDFMRAAKKYCTENGIQLDTKEFLAGYSEGGYAAMAAQKEIEESYSDEIHLTAVSPMAGPYNLIGTAEELISRSTYHVPMYLAFIVTAYDDIYGWNKLNTFFTDNYAEKMHFLFDGTHSYTEINDQLPTQINLLFRQDFLDDFNAGTESLLHPELAENTLLNWVPRTPMRMYHGDSDTTVFYQNSVDALNAFRENGAAYVELITIEGGTHHSAAVPAYMGAIEWFESMSIIQ